MVDFVSKRYSISTTRTCRLFEIWPSKRYYRSRRQPDDGLLLATLTKHASENQDWDHRVLMDWLVRDDFKDNHMKVYRMLVVMDLYSRECLILKIDTSLGRQRVCRVLDRLKASRRLLQVTTARSSGDGTWMSRLM